MALFLEFLTQQWILVAALATAAGLLLYHESRKSGKSMSPQQAINMVNGEDGLFVDVRDSADYERGHIVEALNIPSAKLDQRIAELESYRERPVILVCKMGQHSGAVGKKLGAAGYTRVYRMAGGMMEWTNLQLPLVKS